MHLKKIFILLSLILIICSFSIAFSNATNNKIIISNSHAMAISSMIDDLEQHYVPYAKINVSNFKKYFAENFGDIELEESSEGIWIYIGPPSPTIVGGDARYLIDKNNSTVIKRWYGE